MPMVAQARALRGLPTFLLSSALVVLSSVIVDGWQFSALLAVWVAGTVLRAVWGLHHAGSDGVVFAVANGWCMRKELSSVAIRSWTEAAPLVGSYVIPLVAAIFTTILAVIWPRHGKPSIGSELPKGLSRWTAQYPMPRIFPCETKHARMFPKRHAFQYSYLQCGFPIIPAGITSEGEAVGGSNDCQVGSWWLRIRAADYLNRGSGELGFYGKLKAYLREQVRILIIFLKNILAQWSLICVARSRFRLVIRIPCNRTTIFWLLLQSCVVLVHLRYRPATGKDDTRS